MNAISTLKSAFLAGLFFLVAFSMPIAHATVVTVDFESLPTVAPSSVFNSFFAPPHAVVIGAPLDAYFSGFGITLKNVTAPGTLAGNGVFVDTDVNNQSISNVLGNNNYLDQQTGGAFTSRSYTLEFAQVLDSFSFVRRGFYGLTSSGLIHPLWSAEALDSGGGVLGSVGEGAASTFGSVPSANFAFNMGGIKAVRFNGDHQGFAGRAGAGFDDMVLTFTPVPEPSSILLLALGSMALICKARKQRC